MAPKEVFTFSLEVELDDLEATQRYNEQWELEASDEPTVIPPNEREQGSRASARLIARAFTAQHQQTGLKLCSLRVLD
ncbi:hypothetical protein [Pseudarthrobacter chlorophenolicus]|uniref:hypothetical protein n=1 Tax=Pseudarthrobacter chlorophenolicus TaxID=85085 RepID=UPI0005F29838|nr:hypothetical protein [Pseudarthrobacter chlorophenolicus]